MLRGRHVASIVLPTYAAQQRLKNNYQAGFRTPTSFLPTTRTRLSPHHYSNAQDALQSPPVSDGAFHCGDCRILFPLEPISPTTNEPDQHTRSRPPEPERSD
jgi:hypothetical protein